MKRIAAHATSVETLKNGAKLYHLPGGRVIEQVEGKAPDVVKKGHWPPPAATAAPAATSAQPAATPSVS
jgi:hypothetical protein